MKRNITQPALSAKQTDKVITLLSNFFEQYNAEKAEHRLHLLTQSHIAFGIEHNHDKANAAHLTHEIAQLLTALEKINNKANKEVEVC